MILLCVHPQRCFAMAGITRGEAGIRNAPSPLCREVFLAVILQCVAGCAGFSRPCPDTRGDLFFLCGPCCLPRVGTRGGARAQQCPVPAPPLDPYTFAHRRSSGTRDRVLAFVGITVVSGGVRLPTCLKRNHGLKGPSESTGRLQEVASASSCHPMSLLGTSLASSPTTVETQTSSMAKPGTPLLSHQDVLPK